MPLTRRNKGQRYKHIVKVKRTRPIELTLVYYSDEETSSYEAREAANAAAFESNKNDWVDLAPTLYLTCETEDTADCGVTT